MYPTIPPNVHHSKTTLPRATRRTLTQLITNKCPAIYKHTSQGHEYVDGGSLLAEWGRPFGQWVMMPTEWRYTIS